MNEHQIWFVTGASSGFGRAITEAAVEAGDTVVAAVRRPAALDDLVAAHPGLVHPVGLDATDGPAVDAAVAGALERHGRIDVLVNNAGRTQVGAVEETTDDELRSLFELHFFAAAALTRLVLPHMRAQGAGAIVQMSSVGGQITAPGFGAYCATKLALEGLTQALHDEVAGFGIRTLIVEPGAFRTGLFRPTAAYESAEMPDYADIVGPTREYVRNNDGLQRGDPGKAAQAIIAALDADEPPLRLVLGEDALGNIRSRLAQLSDELATWEDLSRSTT